MMTMDNSCPFSGFGQFRTIQSWTVGRTRAIARRPRAEAISPRWCLHQICRTNDSAIGPMEGLPVCDPLASSPGRADLRPLPGPDPRDEDLVEVRRGDVHDFRADPRGLDRHLLDGPLAEDRPFAARSLAREHPGRGGRVDPRLL